MTFYEQLFHRLIRHADPEFAHTATISALSAVHAAPGGSRALRRAFGTPDPQAAAVEGTEVLGVRHRSPFGLAAGFDKAAHAVLPLLDLGFGHVEVGTITAHAQPGNPRPRSFRLVEDRALINRMGFNNSGADAAAARLRRLRATERGQAAVIGVNIGKTKATSLEDAPEDYRYSARRLAPLATYLAVNVSSPNTPGLRSLQSTAALEPILAAVQEEAEAARTWSGRRPPVLVKIAPDLHDEDVHAVAELVRRIGLDGVIATNTTIARPDSLRTDRARIEQIGAGGLSGPMLADRSREILVMLREELPKPVVLISCGGVQDAADVAERMLLGADLVQGYTNLIYEGPSWPGRIARELAAVGTLA